MDNTVKKISVLAPAKINLCLGVISRRDDGYHNIASVMQTVGLCDKVMLSSSETKGKRLSVVCRGEEAPEGEKNIAYRAAEAFLERAGIDKYDISVEIEKRIPVRSGLGGGSSDAAATLNGLNFLFGMRFNEDELMEIGARIGADVPFLIRRGTAAVTGIGETVACLAPAPSATVLIAFSGSEKLSTGQAYGKIDERGDFSSEESFDKMKAAMKSCDMKKIAAASYNIFESVMPEDSSVFLLKEKMKEKGAVMSLMSGSGSAVFGIFENAAAAKDARDALSDTAKTFICGMFTKDAPYIES
ncbi:MAG: 4-(cytidine 5'-diphospho)-2-C-methyl-D-erythritol kinase [Eubacteriales bacterium]